ncbi:2997_t:CDS:1, partial [Ambispora leptoticha]
SYKERIKKLHQAEDPNKHILENAKSLIPTKDKYHQIIDDYKEWYKRDPKILSAILELYKLYYKLAKDYFITEEQVNKEAEDFLL